MKPEKCRLCGRGLTERTRSAESADQCAVCGEGHCLCGLDHRRLRDTRRCLNRYLIQVATP